MISYITKEGSWEYLTHVNSIETYFTFIYSMMQIHLHESLKIVMVTVNVECYSEDHGNILSIMSI